MDKATHQQTKLHNRDLVLRMIFAHPAISRAEIARLTRLTRTTVSEVMTELLEAGLVREIGLGASIGGKAPILLSLAAQARYLIGVDLAQERFVGVVVNLRGEVQTTLEVPAPGADDGRALENVQQILDPLIHGRWQPIVGVGVATPGLINTRAGVVVNAVNLAWQDFPLAGRLEARYHLPVRLLNDSQAAAIGEYVQRHGHETPHNLIVVTVRHGIGAGLLIGGQLFQGDSGGAGEIGHVVVQPDGALCRCGQRGCLETVASARALLQRSGAPSLAALAADFQAGEPHAVALVLDAARALGQALAHLVGALDIHTFVFTGDLTRFGPAWLNAVEAALRSAVFQRLSQDTRLEFGQLGDHAAALGAAASLLLDHYDLLFTPRPTA